MFLSFDNAEPAVVCDFSLFVFGPIDIVDRDWSGEFLLSDPQLFPCFFIDEVVCSSTINES
jgi:hypothetical protein